MSLDDLEDEKRHEADSVKEEKSESIFLPGHLLSRLYPTETIDKAFQGTRNPT
jgi:hypothetical protein